MTQKRAFLFGTPGHFPDRLRDSYSKSSEKKVVEYRICSNSARAYSLVKLCDFLESVAFKWVLC